jgi:hypothetical protein
MPRSVELTGHTIGLRVGLIPVIDNGQPVRDALGQPKTAEQIVFAATDVKTGDVTAVPMTDAMFAEFATIVCRRVADSGNDQLRQQLIETLTGGLTIPQGKLIELPGGVRS